MLEKIGSVEECDWGEQEWDPISHHRVYWPFPLNGPDGRIPEECRDPSYAEPMRLHPSRLGAGKCLKGELAEGHIGVQYVVTALAICAKYRPMTDDDYAGKDKCVKDSKDSATTTSAEDSRLINNCILQLLKDIILIRNLLFSWIWRKRIQCSLYLINRSSIGVLFMAVWRLGYGFPRVLMSDTK